MHNEYYGQQTLVFRNIPISVEAHKVEPQKSWPGADQTSLLTRPSIEQAIFPCTGAGRVEGLGCRVLITPKFMTPADARTAGM